MNPTDIYVAIVNGDLDGSLSVLERAVKDRKYTLGRVTYLKLNVGDRVKLVNLRPKYLIGQTGTIKAKQQTSITVELDTPSERFGKVVRAKLSMIEAI